MKTILLFLVLMTGMQNPAVDSTILEKVRNDKSLAFLQEGPYRFPEAGYRLTKAPKGYKPFYLTHYGRHGSRYFYSLGGYTHIHDVLEMAHEKGQLTEAGERFHTVFEEFFQENYENYGSLTESGWNEHFMIAQEMCSNFPEIFKGSSRIDMMSSTSFRAIVSMSAAGVGFKDWNHDMDIHQSCTNKGMDVITPTETYTKKGLRFKGETGIPKERASSFQRRIFPHDSFLSRYFKNPAEVDFGKGKNKEWFELNCFFIVTNYHNHESRPLFDDLFTEDEFISLWESTNYLCFTQHAVKAYNCIPLVQDMVCKADTAIMGAGYDADLRFGHDYILDALYYLLNINGCFVEKDDWKAAEDVKYHFQGYDTPMASNIQFVLYRKRNCDEILFKVLRNSVEVSLPQFEPVSGPYYRWNDFKAWVDRLAEEHPIVPFYPW